VRLDSPTIFVSNPNAKGYDLLSCVGRLVTGSVPEAVDTVLSVAKGSRHASLKVGRRCLRHCALIVILKIVEVIQLAVLAA